ncbi:hypothetical protein ACVWXO_004812 [Bradyrhizobium sp. LM2.7]
MMACCTQGALCSSSRRSRCDLPEPELPCTRRRVASNSSRSKAAAAPAMVCPISIATVMSRLRPLHSRTGAYQPGRGASSGTRQNASRCPRRSSGVIRQLEGGDRRPRHPESRGIRVPARCGHARLEACGSMRIDRNEGHGVAATARRIRPARSSRSASGPRFRRCGRSRHWARRADARSASPTSRRAR